MDFIPSILMGCQDFWGAKTFEHPAIGHATAFAVGEHTREFGAKRLKLRDALIDRRQMTRGDFVRIFARFFGLRA
jgi:hypothetical protein